MPSRSIGLAAERPKRHYTAERCNEEVKTDQKSTKPTHGREWALSIVNRPEDRPAGMRAVTAGCHSPSAGVERLSAGVLSGTRYSSPSHRPRSMTRQRREQNG